MIDYLKDKWLKMRCDSSFIEMIDNYVSMYNEKYKPTKKLTRSKFMEEIILRYIWTHRKDVPKLDE